MIGCCREPLKSQTIQKFVPQKSPAFALEGLLEQRVRGL